MGKTIATVAALAFTTTAALTGAAAAAADPAGQDRPDRQRVQVLHWVDKVVPGFNTDIDLGAPGLSAGNQQVFRDPLLRDGRQIGTSDGVAEVVYVNSTTLVAQVVSTITLAAGQLMTQTAFTEILAQGPPKVLHVAITGGTGAYRGAQGECGGEFLANGDAAAVTCRVFLDD